MSFRGENFKFRIPLNALKTLYFDSSYIREITGLNAPQLEYLNLYSTWRLKTLEFKGKMTALKSLDLEGSAIKKITGGEYLSQDCELEMNQGQEITVTHKRGTAQPKLRTRGLGQIRYEEVDE